ncbi:hypothetical protein A3860_05290 [Niastella vici]|uniref:Secretion system C-terminal sorting domain-containing protein n=1 Tax=Niastella vici TaxID=1703345 RepID=A0A1V9FRZ8_9BACT|nr:T9SS type A sorting domain-containing protein [Niastella vici]OQP61134.1 hypothetical protein A3860_05290 [Niastella vici]
MKASNLLYGLMPLIIAYTTVQAQSPQSLKSVLINLGESSCGNGSPEQHLLTNVFSNNPALLEACDPGLPLYWASLAYNPKYRKVYFADYHADSTLFYMLDYNFSGTISCPASVSPLFSYKSGIIYFCFDEDGNNLSLSNYNGPAAQGTVKRIDFLTGNDIPGTEKLINFPPGNAPGYFGDGDIVNLPNGRVFAVLGAGPSRLYEFVNLDGPGNATAVYLSSLPRNCFGIAYLDGNLLMAGYDGSGCYYYTWDINSNSLSAEVSFPLGKGTTDLTHLNLGAGVAQELIGEVRVNANTADIFYKVYLKNKGNCDLVNAQLQSRLTDVFGPGNVVNVQARFSSNPAGLTLNPAFDGITDVNLLAPGQILPNYPTENDSLSIIVTVRATNLVIDQVYQSSVIATGQVGAASNVLSVTDSSNNGNAAKIDPDRNGVSDDAGEGIPTPYMFNVVLASKEWQFNGNLQENTARLQWRPTGQAPAVRSFELQRSTDGLQFTDIAYRAPQPGNEGLYTESDEVANLHAANVYYRLKIIDNNGFYTYSHLVTMHLKEANNNLSMFPNPFTDYISLKVNSSQKTKLRITIYDAAGRALKKQLNDLQPGDNIIIVSGLQFLSKGTYILKTQSGMETFQYKLIK